MTDRDDALHSEATPLGASSKMASQLPKPTGYHILCAVPEIKETHSDDGVIIKVDKTRNDEELLSVVLFVVDLGPDAYQDPIKFPTGPWCAKGDFVLVRPHTGSRLDIHGKSFRMVNDDSIEAIVQDPRGIRRK